MYKKYKLEEYIMLEYDEIEDKTYLMNLEDGVMFELNQTAKMIVECIKDNGNCDRYIEKIVLELGIDKEKVERDCEKYIAQLIAKGCICQA